MILVEIITIMEGVFIRRLQLIYITMHNDSESDDPPLFCNACSYSIRAVAGFNVLQRAT